MKSKKDDLTDGYRIMIITPCHAAHQNGIIMYNELKKISNVNLPQPKLFCVAFDYPELSILTADIVQYQPDWIIVMGVKALDHEKVVSFLRPYSNARWCLWEADNNLQLHQNWVDMKGAFDLIICSRTYTAKKYQDYGNKVIWIPQYCADYYHAIETPHEYGNEEYEIGFVGNFYGDQERLRILKILEEEFDLAVAGEFPPFSEKEARGEEMLKFVKQCKINIDITRDPKIFKTLEDDDSVSDRIYKTMGCGGFFMSYCKVNDALHLKDGQDYVVYNGEDDLIKKAKYYLQHEDERIKIAKSGQNKIKKYHLLSKRIHEYLYALSCYDNNVDFVYGNMELEGHTKG